MRPCTHLVLWLLLVVFGTAPYDVESSRKSKPKKTCVQGLKKRCGGPDHIDCCPPLTCLVVKKMIGASGQCIKSKSGPLQRGGGGSKQNEKVRCTRHINANCGGNAKIKCCPPLICKTGKMKLMHPPGKCSSPDVSRWDDMETAFNDRNNF